VRDSTPLVVGSLVWLLLPPMTFAFDLQGTAGAWACTGEHPAAFATALSAG